MTDDIRTVGYQGYSVAVQTLNNCTTVINLMRHTLILKDQVINKQKDGKLLAFINSIHGYTTGNVYAIPLFHNLMSDDWVNFFRYGLFGFSDGVIVNPEVLHIISYSGYKINDIHKLMAPCGAINPNDDALIVTGLQTWSGGDQ